MIEVDQQKISSIIKNAVKCPDFQKIEKVVVFYRDYNLGIKSEPKRVTIEKNKFQTKSELNYGRIEPIKIFLEEWNK